MKGKAYGSAARATASYQLGHTAPGSLLLASQPELRGGGGVCFVGRSD